MSSADLRDSDERRLVFDSIAELYDRSRPSYPVELLDDLQGVGILSPQAEVLEVGAASGQLTRMIAPRVGSVTALEPGERLAALARVKLAEFPQVVIVRSTLENFQPIAHQFDAVVAGTSFHWIDRAVRFVRCASLLRRHGAVAVFWNLWDDRISEPFRQLEDLYENLAPGLGDHWLPRRSSLASDDSEPGRELFGPWQDRDYHWKLVYQSQAFTDMLATHSAYRMIPANQRQSLLERIRRRIDTDFDGSVVMPYVTALRFAHLSLDTLRAGTRRHNR